MKDLRIVFIGTPEFAVSSLKKIIEEGFKVVAVITAPDRPAGRGRKLQQSAVKEYAVSQNLKVLQPTNLKSDGFLKELSQLNANVQVVVAFRMLPKSIWQLPEFGTFNLHASLLPQYRGAAPINWAVINGENKTGVSTFFLDEKIDTGEVILQEEIEIGEKETAGQLHDRLMETGAKLVIKTLHLIAAGQTNTYRQSELADFKEAPKLTPENTKIDWNKNGQEIYNLIRGLNPYPGAWTYIINGKDKLRVKIFETEFIKTGKSEEAGILIEENKKLRIGTRDGYIFVEELQLPGKRKMKTKELLNGFHFEKGARVL